MKRGYLDITPQIVDHMGQLRELETVRYVIEFDSDIGNSWEVYPGTIYMSPVNVDSRGNLRTGFRVEIKDATLTKPERIPMQYGEVTEMKSPHTPSQLCDCPVPRDKVGRPYHCAAS